MKYLIAIVLALLTGCAAVDYQPYEGKPGTSFKGQGGTKLVVEGVEFWDNGSPPRKFKLLGYATGAIGAGYGADDIIRSSIAAKVKAQGGNAAILVNGSTSMTGMAKASPSLYIATNTRELKYAVIQYEN